MNPTFEGIRLAIETHLSTWDGVPVEMDGFSANQMEPTEPLPMAIANKEPWVRAVIQHGDSRTAGIGSGPCVRRTGLIMFQIFTPENQGSRPAALLADSLVAHFEHFQDGGFETQAMSVQRIGDSNGWYQINCMAPFRAD